MGIDLDQLSSCYCRSLRLPAPTKQSQRDEAGGEEEESKNEKVRFGNADASLHRASV